MSSPQIQGVGQNQVVDPVAIAEVELKQSGGNAKTAFYSLAQKKGVDPNLILNQIKSMTDPMTMIKTLISKNSRIGTLFNLFSGIK